MVKQGGGLWAGVGYMIEADNGGMAEGVNSVSCQSGRNTTRWQVKGKMKRE